MSFLNTKSKDNAEDLHITKVHIHQSVPFDSNCSRGDCSNTTKMCSQPIVRSAELNDAIQIKRRYGEGSKPLFAREDIAVNQQSVDINTKSEQQENLNSRDFKGNHKAKSTSRSSSTSPERYRKRFKETSPRKSYSSEKSKQIDHKTPYFLNKYREEDRLKRLYGNHTTRHEHKSPSRSLHYTKRPYTIKESRFSQRKRSRSRTPCNKHERCHERIGVRASSTSSKTRKASPVKDNISHKKPYFVDKNREKDRLRRLYGSSEKRKSLSPPSPHKSRREASCYRRSLSRERRYRHSAASPRRKHSSHRARTPRHSRSHSPEYRRRSLSRDRDRDRYRYSPFHSTLRSSDYHDSSCKQTPQFIPIPIPVAPESFAAAYPYTSYCVPPTPAWGPPPSAPHRIPSSNHRPHHPQTGPIIGYPIIGPMVRQIAPTPYNHMSYIAVPSPRMQWYPPPRATNATNRINNVSRSKKKTFTNVPGGKTTV